MLQVEMKNVGGPEVLKVSEVPLPVPSNDQVLIEVHYAGVNRPDVAQREGRYPPPPGASPILGLEVSGTIAQCKADSGFQIGDPVCALVPGGGYAEFCLTSPEHCLPLPLGHSLEEAAGIPETFFTVWANVFQRGKLKSGERILIHGGSSGIGTTAIQLAKAFGAEVYVTAGSDLKCTACKEIGADYAINYKTSTFEEEILRLTDNQGVHLILDMVGGTYTERNMECLAVEGRLIQIATQLGAKATINLSKMMQKRLTLTGSTLRPRSVADKGMIAQELKKNVWPLFQNNQIKVVIDKVFPLAEVQKAHEYLESGTHIGKIILKVK